MAITNSRIIANDTAYNAGKKEFYKLTYQIPGDTVSNVEYWVNNLGDNYKNENEYRKEIAKMASEYIEAGLHFEFIVIKVSR